MNHVLTLRRMLVFLGVLGLLGLAAELAAVGHWYGLGQLIPFAAILGSVVVCAWYLFADDVRSRLALRVVAALLVLTGLYGALEHTGREPEAAPRGPGGRARDPAQGQARRKRRVRFAYPDAQLAQRPRPRQRAPGHERSRPAALCGAVPQRGRRATSAARRRERLIPGLAASQVHPRPGCYPVPMSTLPLPRALLSAAFAYTLPYQGWSVQEVGTWAADSGACLLRGEALDQDFPAPADREAAEQLAAKLQQALYTKKLQNVVTQAVERPGSWGLLASYDMDADGGPYAVTQLYLPSGGKLHTYTGSARQGEQDACVNDMRSFVRYLAN